LTPTRPGVSCTNWLTTCPASARSRSSSTPTPRRGRWGVVRRRLPEGARRRRAERLRWDHRGGWRTQRGTGVAHRGGTSGRRHHCRFDPTRRHRYPREAPKGDATPERTFTRATGTFGTNLRQHALVQNADELLVPVSDWKCVTFATPTDQQLQDLAIAWRVCARTTSNAIVIARDGVAVGIGAGQQSRVVSAGIATTKASEFRPGRGRGVGRLLPLRRRPRVTDERRCHLSRATGRFGRATKRSSTPPTPPES